MACDSPQSEKSFANPDEEDKEQQLEELEDEIAEKNAQYLVKTLKRMDNEEVAAAVIKNTMKEFKRDFQYAKEKATNRKNYSSKETKMFKDFVIKLSKDNDILKKGVNKLCEKERLNNEKLSQFDKLAKECQRLQNENKMLKSQVEFHQYQNSSPCMDQTFHSGGNNFGGGFGSTH